MGSFAWKHNIFQEHAIAKIFSVLHSTYKGDTTYQVWIDLNNSMTRSEIIFSKFQNYLFEEIGNLKMTT